MYKTNNKFLARDLHYKLIEEFGLVNDPASNTKIREIILETLNESIRGPVNMLKMIDSLCNVAIEENKNIDPKKLKELISMSVKE